MTSLAQIRELPAWPEPDLSVLNGGRAEPARMPSALFGPAWGFLEVVAENVSTAPDYPAIALLASTASLIGGKRKVRPYPESNWCEPCILWCGVVGVGESWVGVTAQYPKLHQITAQYPKLHQI